MSEVSLSYRCDFLMPTDAHLLTELDGTIPRWSEPRWELREALRTHPSETKMPNLVVPAALLQPAQELIREALAGRRASVLTVLEEEKGTRFWAKLLCWKIQPSEMELLAWRIEDQTAEKTSQAAQILSRRHTKFLEVLPGPVLVVDAAARILYANATSEKLTGQNTTHWVGRALGELLQVEPDLHAHCLNLMHLSSVQAGSPLVRLQTRLSGDESATVQLSMRLFDSDSEAGVLWIMMLDMTASPVAPRASNLSDAGSTLYLQMREQVLEIAEPTPKPAPPQPAHARTKPRVLLVDDEAAIRDILSMHLESDFEVLSAHDGQEGLAMAREHLPDLILSDIRMPLRNGLELCQDLRADDLTRDIPVVMLTATDDQTMKLNCLAAGATDFLSKPCSGAELLLRARNLSRLHLQQQELTQKTERLEQALQEVKQKDEMLARQERLAALGRMSAGLIHEINNPLNYSMQGLSLLRQSIPQLPVEMQAEFAEVVGDIEEGIGRVARIVNDLRGFARSPTRVSYQPTRLASVVHLAVKHLSHVWDTLCEPEVRVDETLHILADKHQMVQVMVNLVKNALDALSVKSFPDPERPQLTLTSLAVEKCARLVIRDNGIGMEPEVCAHIFEPFYTTKEVGKGLGLGLSICHTILSEHGAQVKVSSEPGRYTEFVLDFPLVEESEFLS